MRPNFLSVFIEVVYSTLQHPEDLPAYIRKIPALKGHIIGAMTLSSFSWAVGRYLLRDYYESSYWLTIIASTFIYFFFIFIAGFLFGTLADAFVRLKYPDRSGQAWQMVGISLLASMPYMLSAPLSFPAAMLGNYFKLSGHLMMSPILFALSCWTTYIIYSGLQLLYELRPKEALQMMLKSAGIVFLFPAAASFFLFLELSRYFT